MKRNKLQFTISLIFLLISSSISSIKAQDGEFKLDKIYSMDPNGTIDMQTDDAKIKITGTNRKDVHVNIYRKEVTHGWKYNRKDFYVDVDARGGDLFIKEEPKTGIVVSVGYMREEYEIIIEAPEGVSLVLKGDDDDYIIRNINGSIYINIDDGDAELIGCSGNHFEFEIDDGDIEMDEGKGYLYIRADDADVYIQNGKFDDVNATLDDGDLIIETSLANNGSYSFRVDDGSIELYITDGGGEFDIRHDDARISSSREFILIDKDENETFLELPNGTARVKVRADDARIRLNTM